MGRGKSSGNRPGPAQLPPLPGTDDIKLYHGRLIGYAVWVENTAEALDLYDHGFFGKGVLSRSRPEFDSRNAEKTRRVRQRKKVKRTSGFHSVSVVTAKPARGAAPTAPSASSSSSSSAAAAAPVSAAAPVPAPAARDPSPLSTPTRVAPLVLAPASPSSQLAAVDMDVDGVDVDVDVDAADQVAGDDGGGGGDGGGGDNGVPAVVPVAKTAARAVVVRPSSVTSTSLFNAITGGSSSQSAVPAPVSAAVPVAAVAAVAVSAADGDDDDAASGDEEAAGVAPGVAATEAAAHFAEPLQLSLEEAFFLAWALGCLIVCDDELQTLTIDQLWLAACSAQPTFPYTYAAYHFYRSHCWCVKSGIKYGTEFVLYRTGPSLVHAEHAVMVLPADATTKRVVVEERAAEWRTLFNLNRVAQQVAKDLVLCYVLRPADMSDAELGSPECVRRLTVEEVGIRRWVPDKVRTSDGVKVRNIKR